MITLSGSAHPLHHSVSQPCPDNKRYNGLITSRQTPELQELWTAHPRDRIIGSRADALFTQFTGFSICHPMYDDKHTFKVVQHTTASALNNQGATATFLLLPNWMENSTNALHKACTDNTILVNIPKTKMRYMPLLYQQSKTPPLPDATWGMRILIV
jgi:hypothetical protein